MFDAQLLIETNKLFNRKLYQFSVYWNEYTNKQSLKVYWFIHECTVVCICSQWSKVFAVVVAYVDFALAITHRRHYFYSTLGRLSFPQSTIIVFHLLPHRYKQIIAFGFSPVETSRYANNIVCKTLMPFFNGCYVCRAGWLITAYNWYEKISLASRL